MWEDGAGVEKYKGRSVFEMSLESNFMVESAEFLN